MQLQDETEILTKEFHYGENGWGGMNSKIIAWVSFYCPYCNDFHAESFLFTPKIGKKEYIGTCEVCKKQLRIKIDILTNNALVKQQEINIRRFEDKYTRNGNKSLERWGING